MGSSPSNEIFKHLFTQEALRIDILGFDSDLLEGIFGV